MRPMRWCITWAGPSVLVALSLACSGDGGTTPGVAAALNVVSGDHQTAPPNTELPQPLVVRVTDANGQPVEGQVVNFHVTGGGGSMFAGAGSTNADGIVQDRWTLGPADGPQTAEARAVDNTTGAPLVFATFAATAASPPTLSRVDIVGAWSGTATVGTHVPPVTLLAKDQFGAPLPNYTFTLRSMTAHTTNGFSCSNDPGDDQLENPTLTTGPDGTVTFSGWTLGTRRGYKCLGIFPGTTQPQNPNDVGAWQLSFKALPGPPAQLVKVRQDNQQAPDGTTLSSIGVAVQDQYGNNIGCSCPCAYCVDPDTPEAQVAFTPSVGGQVSQAQTMTDRGGAYTDWTLAPGVNTLTITVGTLSTTYTATGT
jgi:Bacterial Ig-like domain (group 1)